MCFVFANFCHPNIAVTSLRIDLNYERTKESRLVDIEIFVAAGGSEPVTKTNRSLIHSENTTYRAAPVSLKATIIKMKPTVGEQISDYK